MDPLARIEPVARPLLQAVDSTLATVGAPSEHPVWALLREVGTVPGDAVTLVSMADPAQLRDVGERLRATAITVEGVTASSEVNWRGRAGKEYAARAHDLDAHLRGDLSGGLRDTGRYLDEVARWQERSRLDVAGALADVLVSTEALTLAHARAAGPGAGAPVTRTAILAAADVGAYVLAAVAAAIEAGEALLLTWGGLTEERPFLATAAAGASTPMGGRVEDSIEIRR